MTTPTAPCGGVQEETADAPGSDGACCICFATLARRPCGCAFLWLCDGCLGKNVAVRGPVCPRCREPFDCDAARAQTHRIEHLRLLAEVAAQVVLAHERDGGFPLPPEPGFACLYLTMSLFSTAWPDDFKELIEGRVRAARSDVDPSTLLATFTDLGRRLWTWTTDEEDESAEGDTTPSGGDRLSPSDQAHFVATYRVHLSGLRRPASRQVAAQSQ